jgi:ribosomal protein S3AE
MSNFITLRLILQEAKPDVRQFMEELSREELKKSDYDILLRKAVESKVPEFRQFCDALVR